MKKVILIFSLIALILILAACSTDRQDDTNTNTSSQTVSGNESDVYVPDTHTFTGRVLSIEDGMILVHNDEENSAISPQVYVNVSQFPELELKKGDKVRVVFNGQVAQSYPPQILGVISITKE